MSHICPLSSWRESERKLNGSKTPLMSGSDRLVTHMRRFENCESTRSSTSLKTFSRGDGITEAFGHSSKASKIKYTGAWPGNLSKFFRHVASASSLGCREPLACSK